MDKSAALKAAAATAVLIIFSVLLGFAITGRIWARAVLAVIFVGIFCYSCYNLFKD